MAPRVVDRPLYLELVQAFRELGQSFNGVANRVGISRTMARRAYISGWPEQFHWARPIASVLGEDDQALRAVLFDDVDIVAEEAAAETAAERRRIDKLERSTQRLRERHRKRAEQFQDEQDRLAAERAQQATKAAEEAARLRAEVQAQAIRERQEAIARRTELETAEEQEREKARQQAVEARQQEAQLVRLARGAAIGTLGGTMRLMPALAKLADQLRIAVEAGQIPPEKAASTINQISRTVKDATVAAQVVIELERLHVGAPQAIVGVVQHEVPLDEAAISIEEFQAAIERSRSLGLVGDQTISISRKERTS